jgi:site-specific recombinase XerD
MTEDMQMRNLAPRTQGCYLDCIAKFARFHGGSPSELGRGEVRDYLAYLAHERHASASYLRQTIAALRFVYRVTLDNADVVADIPWPKQPRRLPVVLSRQEVARLLAAAVNLKHRAMLMTAYGAGLRLGELTHLRTGDIDRERMLLRVRQGKGRRDRMVCLSARLLAELDHYHAAARPTDWLFVGARPGQPISASAVQKESGANPWVVRVRRWA